MPLTDKLDLYKLHKADYATPKKPILIDIQPAQYLMVEGRGGPEGECFHTAMQALYGAAFTIKMTRKFAGLGNYAVCKLEGLWWTDGNEQYDFEKVARDAWRWKLLIRTPDFITQDDLDKAKEALSKKGKGAEGVMLETLKEGRCVQMLHVGPYEKEGPTIIQMHEFAQAEGFSPHGRHHEIYLSDPRRVAPEKLRTILRHPVKK